MAFHGNTHKDSILVCGTGIAGLAAALGLTRAGYPVTLLGPREQHAAHSGDDYCPRVYAISPASKAFLVRLGAWNLMDMRRVTPVQGMEVHGDAEGVVNLHAWQAAQDALAWIVESSEIEKALRQAVQVYGLAWVDEKFVSLQDGVVQAGTRPATASAGQGGADTGRALPAGRVVHTDTGRTLTPSLVVGADGAKSAVRQAAGITHHSRPYGDTGIVVHLDSELPHQGLAVQWFTGDSVLALLPMPDTAQGAQVSMVWSLPGDTASEWMALPEDTRRERIESRLLAATGGRLGALRVRSKPFAFPLFIEHSDMVAPGVALVSDAGHRVHPLAGQGLNLGLGDVEALVRVLAEKEQFRRAGDMRLLHRYRRARAEPVLAMRLATDGLHRLFAAQPAPIAWARNAGMLAADRLPFVKRLLIGAAAGHG